MIVRLRLAFGILVAAVAVAAAAQPTPGTPGVGAKPFVIYVSHATRTLLANDAVDLKTRVNRWRDLLVARGASYTIVTHPAQLAQVPAGVALILPSAVVLGDDEQRLIAQRIEAGDGLLATWMPASLDANGAAVAPRFVEQAFKVTARAAATGEKGFLITIGDTPLTYALPAGSRLWVGKEGKYSTPLLATPAAGYLSDWSRAEDGTGLLAFTTVGASRRALLGWPEGAWDGTNAEFVKLAQLALDWVEGRPVAYLRTWPSPWRGAMTLGIDALWRFENVPRIAAAMSKVGLHGSFHFLSTDAKANAAVIRDLLRDGHSLGGFGDAAQPFAGLPEAEQRTRVERMVQEFRAALGPGAPVSGLRAPQGATDAATEKAAAMLDYLVDAGRVDAAVPQFAPDRRLVVLAAGTNIDSNASLDAITAGLDAAAKRAQLLGGYAFVGVDVAGYQPGSPLEAGLQKFVEASQGSPLWSASAADVARWWREHDQLKVASAWDAAASTLSIEVAVGEAMVFPAAIAIVPPPGMKSVRIEPAYAGAELQSGAAGATALVLSGLPPGSHRLQLRFAP